jgi:molybdenum-dependent DNA-binding transcriptional regulator ModE
VRLRRSRRTGGQYTGSQVTRYEDRLVAERERIAAELALLAASDLSTDQRAEVDAALSHDHDVSMRDLRAGLARAQAKAA